MRVVDLRSDDEFMTRQTRPRCLATEISGIQRLADVFAQRPERILQELVKVSVDMCGADSAGVNLEQAPSNRETQFRWIAAAGKGVTGVFKETVGQSRKAPHERNNQHRRLRCESTVERRG
jgi:hypothetical protein